jgi:predicted nucleic acid-binding protein
MERAALLIDTSILIDHLRKPRKDKTIFYRFAQQRELLISAITEFEFSIGATPKNRAYIEKLLAKLPALPFDSTCVKTAAEIYRDLKARNQLISLPDIFIAATALVHGVPLATLNRKHFERIDNLQLAEAEIETATTE